MLNMMIRGCIPGLWIADTGANFHACCEADLLQNYSSRSNNAHQAGVGRLVVYAWTGSAWKRVVMDEVWHYNIDFAIISIARLLRRNWSCVFTRELTCAVFNSRGVPQVTGALDAEHQVYTFAVATGAAPPVAAPRITSRLVTRSTSRSTSRSASLPSSRTITRSVSSPASPGPVPMPWRVRNGFPLTRGGMRAILDSGAPFHLMNDDRYIENLRDTNEFVMHSPNGELVRRGVGTMTFMVLDGTTWNVLRLEDVWLVRGATGFPNVISIPILNMTRGWNVSVWHDWMAAGPEGEPPQLTAVFDRTHWYLAGVPVPVQRLNDLETVLRELLSEKV